MSSISQQRGAALLIGVFLIMVIGLAVGGMIALSSTTQQITSARNLEVTRAFYAARAKLDREIANVATPANDKTPTCPAPVGDPPTNFATTREDCTAVPVDEGGADYTVFFIEVSAAKGSRDSGTRVERRLEAVVTNID
jgi:MSHA biogenesis protein MshP